MIRKHLRKLLLIICISLLIIWVRWLFSQTVFVLREYPINFLGAKESVDYLPRSLKTGFVFFRNKPIERYIIPLTVDDFSSTGYRINLPQSGDYHLFMVTASVDSQKIYAGDEAGGEILVAKGKVSLKRWQKPFNFGCCIPVDLIENGSFEQGLWENSGSVRLSSDYLEGTRSAELIGFGDQNSSISKDVPEIKGNTYYKISFSYRNVRGNNLSFLLTEIHDDGSEITIVRNPDRFYNWETYVVPFKTQPQTRSLKISFKSAEKGNQEGIILIDDVKLYENFKPAGILLKNVDLGEKQIKKPNILDLLFFYLARIEAKEDGYLRFQGPFSDLWGVFDLNNLVFISPNRANSSVSEDVLEVPAASQSRSYLFFNYVFVLIMFLIVIFTIVTKYVSTYYSQSIWRNFLEARQRVLEFFLRVVESKSPLLTFILIDIFLVNLYLSNFFFPLFTNLLLILMSLSLFYYLIRPPNKVYLYLSTFLIEFGFIIGLFNRFPLMLSIFKSEDRLLLVSNQIVYLGIYHLLIIFFVLIYNEYFKKPKN